MSVGDEFKSGNFSLYAQLTAILTLVLMIILSAVSILSHTFYKVLAIIFAIVIFLIEVPFVGKIVPNSDKLEEYFGGTKKLYWRFILYLAFSAIMWLAVTKGSGILGICAFLLTLTTAFYLVAAVRRQDPITSRYLGGSGI
ncbi:Golgi apparatus membrane protein tvp18 [Smittium culicis]|uniref:Golgi apparatus membrane protein tvp18 n=1 Tax=Smittium culicis TaxID=133412 RepID=A0A1R1X126_9FUNG|nr:Golgi apparatus membrane protein tvp18 [Smittium culicis]OMJ14591.1 Golgi apparatus membrane protein tvp18 [Smittium culicis]